ncbi:MAG: anthranilate phosphoribosyltransferase [Candidatus Omnitrophica bacterium]|nr:anthranilate phosphoribosyltransferase [Candidatus Omnitrophota bacterium]
MQNNIVNILVNKDLGDKVSRLLFRKFFFDEIPDSEKKLLLAALHKKGETVEEITGLIRALTPFMSHYSPHLPYLVDTCGTGGDCQGTFNISTISAFVVAAAGAKVAKHGNRSISSRCGSSDLMESLGVNIESPPRVMLRCLREAGIAYLHAPLYNRAMRVAQPIRKELGIRTIFNIIGPLVNPFKVKRQIIGLPAESVLVKYAEVMKRLEYKHAIIVHGRDGLDEITITKPTVIVELKANHIRRYTFDPRSWGIPRAKLSQLRGGDVKKNRRIALEILKNKLRGPKRDIVSLNAAFALYASGRCRTPRDGWRLANDVLTRGLALKTLYKLRRMTNS